MGTKTLKLFGKEILSIETRSYSKEQVAGLYSDILGSGTSVRVNENTATKLTAIFRSINLISDSVAIPPANVMERKGKSRILVPDHPVQKLIHSRPNPYLTSLHFRFAMTALAMLRGGSYAEIVRDSNARPIEMHIISDPANVYPVIYDNRLWYKIPGRQAAIPSENMFCILWTTKDGYNPISPIKAASISISRGLSASLYAEKIFAAGGTKKMALATPDKVDENQKKNLRESWLNEHGGIENSHKIPILEGGLEIKEVGITPEDAQLLEAEEFTVEEISRIYGIPLHMLSHTKAGGYNSNEQQNLEFLTYTMNAWYARWESECNEKLLWETEKPTHLIDIDNSWLLRGDSRARMNYYKARFSMGAITVNEIREREGDAPYDLPNSDKPMIQAQYIPLDKAGEKIMPAPVEGENKGNE